MKRTIEAFLLFSMLNFVVFVCLALFLGGDALSGKVQDGHYFLSDHGKLQEVSRAVFTYSRWHSISLVVSWPFVLASAWWLHVKHPSDLPAWLAR